MNTHMTADTPAIDRQHISAYIVGGGIAGLASAAYLLHAGHLRGENIHVIETSDQVGGSLDAHGAPEHGYVIQGARKFDAASCTCTFDLMSFIPSLENSLATVQDEFLAFNDGLQAHAVARLVSDGQGLDVSSPGFSAQDRLALAELVARSEVSLGMQRIDDCFEPAFFETNFWLLWCTSFAFQRWHSAVEFRRYLLRFVQELPRIETLGGVLRTTYNQYDSLVRPLVSWLQFHGVRFDMNTRVTSLDFQGVGDATRVERLRMLRDGVAADVAVREHDLVFTTLGSMTSGAVQGSQHAAPGDVRPKDAEHHADAWALWHAIATWRPEFGRPSVFDSHVDESMWESFSMTFKGPEFPRRMEAFTGNAAGSGGLVTFKDSNWLMSITLPHQPHVLNQPDGLTVCWGHGLLPKARGNYVDKRMVDCSGAEILAELFAHLRFDATTPGLLAQAHCIPCVLPYVTSQFLVRAPGDRPAVVPKGALNFAFIGQFCEIPDDVVFTIEYSVRSAQIAVFELLGLDRAVSPLYKGYHDPRVLLNSVKALMRQ